MGFICSIKTVCCGWALALSCCLAFTSSSALADQRPFTPNLAASSSTYQAAANPNLTLSVEANDDYEEQRLQSFVVDLPTGLFSSQGSGDYCGLVYDGDDYSCSNEDSQVGTLEAKAIVDTDTDPDLEDLEKITLTAKTYLEEPQSGEAAELVTLFNADKSTVLKASVELADSGDHISITMDDLPTTVISGSHTYDLFTHKISMVFEGSKTVDSQTVPPTFNPSFCDSDNHFAATLTSYGDDGVAGSDDVTVTDEAPYLVTGCDALSYSPTTDLNFSSLVTAAPTTFSSSIDLASGSATTESISLTAPSGFLLNPSSGLTKCDSDNFEAGSCGQASLLGSAKIVTPLVQDAISGLLYLGPADGSRLKVAAVFTDPLSLRLDGYLEQSADGGLVTHFDNPPIPFTHTEFSLDGVSGPILLNPFKCGAYTTTAALTSSNDKSATYSESNTVGGCSTVSAQSTPSFKVTLSKPHSGSYTDAIFDFKQSSPQQIKKVSFELPKNVDLHLKKPRLKRGDRSAYFELWDKDQHVYRGTLKLKKKRRNYLTLTASSKKLKKFTATVQHKKTRDLITLKNIPGAEATDFSLTMFGRASHMLRVAKRKKHAKCRKQAKFLASISFTDVVSKLDSNVDLSCKKGK